MAQQNVEKDGAWCRERLWFFIVNAIHVRKLCQENQLGYLLLYIVLMAVLSS